MFISLTVHHRRGGLGGCGFRRHRAAADGGLLPAADAGPAGVGLEEGAPEFGAPDLIISFEYEI